MAEMKEQAGLHLHEQSSWGRSPELGPGHLQKSRKLNPRLLSRQKDQQTDRQMAGIGVAGQVRLLWLPPTLCFEGMEVRNAFSFQL